jgi:hypothetical protein
MGQEAKKEINFESLKAIVDDAIKNKNTSAIEAIEDEMHLRYIEKYLESLISNNSTKISFLSLDTDIKGISIGFIAAGLSLFLGGLSIDNISKILYSIGGIIVMFLGLLLDRKTNKYKREFEKVEKDIGFMHTIILKIEEKLLKKT